MGEICEWVEFCPHFMRDGSSLEIGKLYLWAQAPDVRENWICTVRRFRYHYVVKFERVFNDQPGSETARLRITRMPATHNSLHLRRECLRRDIARQGHELFRSHYLWEQKHEKITDFVTDAVLTHSFFCGGK